MGEKRDEIFAFLPESARGILRHFRERENLLEIRMGVGRPLYVRTPKGLEILGAEPFTREEIMRTVERMAKGSIYAVQSELSRGYLTLPGGHRVGITGTAVLEGGVVTHMKHLSSVNIRLAREVVGCARPFLPMIAPGGKIKNTLIISPPCCGKTTLLRDIARTLGGEEYSLSVSVADERGEIAATYMGEAGNRVGIFTDVLDECPKAPAMEMLIRSMSPDVVITDEIGAEEDARSIYSLVNAGVKVICSAHGFSERDCMRRKGLRELLEDNIFECVITLSARHGPCTLERVR